MGAVGSRQGLRMKLRMQSEPEVLVEGGLLLFEGQGVERTGNGRDLNALDGEGRLPGGKGESIDP